MKISRVFFAALLVNTGVLFLSDFPLFAERITDTRRQPPNEDAEKKEQTGVGNVKICYPGQKQTGTGNPTQSAADVLDVIQQAVLRAHELSLDEFKIEIKLHIRILVLHPDFRVHNPTGVEKIKLPG